LRVLGCFGTLGELKYTISMANVSAISGKKTLIGNRRKHKHSEGWKFRAQTTSRTWKPNFRKASVIIEGVKKRVKLTVKEYKHLSKKGQVVK
jgi:ribosomal protein L28